MAEKNVPHACRTASLSRLRTGLFEDAAAAADEGGDGDPLLWVALQQTEDARAEAAKPAQHLLRVLRALLPRQRLLPDYPCHHLQTRQRGL